MILDWPLAVVTLGSLAAMCVALKLVLPYLVGHSTEKAREKALADVTERLNRVEAHLVANVRKMPGRLG